MKKCIIYVVITRVQWIFTTTSDLKKAIVIPRGEAPRVTMKLFEVTSGGKFPLYPSDDYINGIVYAEKTPVKPFLRKG